MSAFTVGFLFIMIFTLFVGFGAAFLISFDADGSEQAVLPPAVQSPYTSVRRINTDLIETVDAAGTIQRWEKSVRS